MNSNLRTGDTVVVIAGKDKGKIGKITASNSEDNRVVVEGVNIVHKHRNPRSQTEKGGITKVESGIDVSNVQIICPTCHKATRIAHIVDEKGKKHRMCKKCSAILDTNKKVKTVKKETKAVKAEDTETKVEKEAKKPTTTHAVKKTVAPKASSATTNKAVAKRRQAQAAKSAGR